MTCLCYCGSSVSFIVTCVVLLFHSYVSMFVLRCHVCFCVCVIVWLVHIAIVLGRGIVLALARALALDCVFCVVANVLSVLCARVYARSFMLVSTCLVSLSLSLIVLCV